MTDGKEGKKKSQTSFLKSFSLQTWDYFLAGAVAGTAGLLSGYPLDTIKVRMQTETSNTIKRPPLTVFLQTVRKEGVFALYKGVASPLVGEGFIQAIVFGTYGLALQVITSFRSQNGTIQNPQLKHFDYANAGCWVGVACSVVASPVELVKNKLQIQGEAGAQKIKLYSGPLDALVKTIRNEGILKGLYKGYTMTLAREIPSYAAYFWGYEVLKILFIQFESQYKLFGTQGNDLNAFYLLTAGGFAGVLSWLVSYPQDVIKTRLQIQNAPTVVTPMQPGSKLYTGPIDCFNSMIKEEGISSLTRGLGVVLIRAYIVNAVTFYAYEVVLSTVKKLQNKQRRSTRAQL